MADEPENLTLRILQELRGDMQSIRGDLGELRADLRELRDEVKDLSNRLNGNTVILSSIAGMCFDHEERISKLEAR